MDQIEKIHLDARKAEIRRRADQEIARIGLREALEAPTVDQKAVDARIKELTDLHAASLRAHVDQMLQMKKILTPEQQAKLKELRRQHPFGRRGGQGFEGRGQGRRGQRQNWRRPQGPPNRDEDPGQPQQPEQPGGASF
jgi:Spy/CpxP family protein refolding chaperone